MYPCEVKSDKMFNEITVHGDVGPKTGIVVLYEIPVIFRDRTVEILLGCW